MGETKGGPKTEGNSDAVLSVRATGAANVSRELIQCWAINGQMWQIVLDLLDEPAWRAQFPVSDSMRGSKVRTIAAIVTHVHSIRRKWLRLSAPHIQLLPKLNRTSCTPAEARAALAKSAEACSQMLTEALQVEPAAVDGPGQAKVFLGDGWAKPWPAGPAMLAYMLTHEAHHRGQVCMLAHQFGFPLPAKATSAMWNWERMRLRI
jgi:uncharacterized damage-inducible protein DinB